jgi:cation diffusion facilitator family transporter
VNDSRRSVLAALAANSGIAVTKLIAAVISGSTSMLAEGIHSVADTGNQLLLLLGLSRSEKPPDEDHPFGHGKERFFWTFVVALMLFSVGGLVSITRGVTGLEHREEPPGLWLGVVVLLLAAVFEGSALRVALRTFNRDRGKRSFYAGLRRAKDPETLTVVFEDTAALSGLAAAMAGLVLSQVLDDSRFDAAGAIVVGVILMVVAFALARESRDLLLGESATREVRQAIREAIEACGDVEEIRDFLTMHVGPDQILVNVEIAFRDGLDTDGVEAAIRDVERRVQEAVPTVGRIFVEPRRPTDSGAK